MYDDASPSEAQSAAHDTRDSKSDETEDQLALVQKSFFKDEPKPGNREMVEIVQVYENEVSIKCVYGEGEKAEEEEEEESQTMPPEDSMMT